MQCTEEFNMNTKAKKDSSTLCDQPFRSQVPNAMIVKQINKEQ